MSSNVSLNDFAVLNSDGSLNEVASADKFLETLRAVIAAQAVANEELGTVVNAVFDQHPNGTYIPSDMVVNTTLVSLGLHPTTPEWTEKGKQIKQFLKNCATRYPTKKGPGGGITRAVQAVE